MTRDEQKAALIARIAARPPKAKPVAVRSLPCIHEGRELTGTERERAGLKHERRWLECENPAKPIGEIVCPCMGCGIRCPGYSAESNQPVGQSGPEGKRHLVYHILPVIGNGTWQRGVDQLRARWPLFTGTKTIAVMTRTNRTTMALDPPNVVREYLPHDADVIELPNDPDLREVVSWVPLWERVLASAEPHDAIMYAHAKGVTRKVDAGNSCHWWASLLYSLMLDHWPAVARQLERHPITGPFKKNGSGFAGSRSQWHYSGAFFWARAGDFRGRRWQRADRKWWGNESWPGLAYPAKEAGCLFHEGRVPTLNLYDPRYWSLVRTELSKWLKLNPPAHPFLETILSAGS